MIKATHGQIQLGNRMLDVEIEMEQKPIPVDPELSSALKRIREDMYRWSAGFTIKPLYGSSELGNPPVRIVEGSLAEEKQSDGTH